jgi:hypothetical protein
MQTGNRSRPQRLQRKHEKRRHANGQGRAQLKKLKRAPLGSSKALSDR